jgi:hypothetical protein
MIEKVIDEVVPGLSAKRRISSSNAPSPKVKSSRAWKDYRSRLRRQEK